MKANNKDKLYNRLLHAVGRQVEVAFADGGVLYGRLDSFNYDHMVLAVDGNDGRHIVNFRYVKYIRTPKTRGGG